MIAIIDYGVGNLFSLRSSLTHLGLEAVVTADAQTIRKADRLILPGVGAFADAMAKLEATGLVSVIKEESQKKPLLGICLGMQLLFEKSYEYGEHEGLGFVKGEVCPLEPDLADKSLKVPQIGWNALHIVKDDPLFKYIREGEYVYYVHSYYGKNFVKTIVNAGKKFGKLEVVNDQCGNPTNAVDLAHEILQLCVTHEYGLYHCTGEGICSWYDFAAEIIRLSGVDATVAPCTSEEYKAKHPDSADRPKWSALDNRMLRCTVGNDVRDWKDALACFFTHWDGDNGMKD